MIVSNRRIDLIHEGVDVAVRVREDLDTDGDLQMRTVMRSGAILVASPGFLDHFGRPACPNDISGFATLSQTDRADHRWTLVDANGVQETVRHEPRVSATEFAILRQAALEGLGIALLAEYTCREALASGRLERVLPGWAGREATLHLVYTSRRGLLPSVRSTIDFLAEMLHPESPSWAAAA